MFFKLLLLDIRIEELRASSYTLRRPRATCSPVKIPLRTTCPSNRKVDLVESFRASLLIVCNVGRGLRVPLHVRIGIRNGLETNRQLYGNRNRSETDRYWQRNWNGRPTQLGNGLSEFQPPFITSSHYIQPSTLLPNYLIH